MVELTGLKGFSAYLVYNKLAFALIFCRQFNYLHNEQLALIHELKQATDLDEFKAIASELTADKFKTVSYTIAEVIDIFKAAPEEQKRVMLFEALTHCQLDDSEALRLLALHKDSNGVAYNNNNITNIDVKNLMPLMLDTLIACAELQVDFFNISQDELELLAGHRADIKADANEILSHNSKIPLNELIPLALKRFFTRVTRKG